jgi:hypothetical protein
MGGNVVWDGAGEDGREIIRLVYICGGLWRGVGCETGFEAYMVESNEPADMWDKGEEEGKFGLTWKLREIWELGGIDGLGGTQDWPAEEGPW